MSACWWREFATALAGRGGESSHEHRWTETSRRFNLPCNNVSHTGFLTDERVMELAYGITVVELRCAGCGDVKAVRYAGDGGGR